MKHTDFAPHLAGHMLPPMLTALLPRKPRFEGDTWATQMPTSMWYWMHATGCTGGLYRALRNEEFWQRVEEADPTQPRIPDGWGDIEWVFMPQVSAAPRAPAKRATPPALPVQADLFGEEPV